MNVETIRSDMTATQYHAAIKTAVVQLQKTRKNVAELAEVDKGLAPIPKLKKQREKLFSIYESIDNQIEAAAIALLQLSDDVVAGKPVQLEDQLAKYFYALNDANEKALNAHLHCLQLHVQCLENEAAKAREIVSKNGVGVIRTSQEMDILHRAQCDGKRFTGYSMNDQSGAIIYERPGSSHQIRLTLTENERMAGIGLSNLESLVRAQNADAVLATSFILEVLAPPAPLPPRALASGWVDFNDVIKSIGWYPQTTDERREMHAQIWDTVKFGELAHIRGKRSGQKYKLDGVEIDTTIDGAAWRVMKTETPDGEPNGAPVRAEIAVSTELTALITHPSLAQYLPGADILGAIPGGQAAGAWARVIGVALASFWRRKPRETCSGTIRPTRRELLDHFAAKVAPYEEILASSDPQRAIKYWCGALQILADAGFIERTEEAAITAKAMRADLPRKNWQSKWLDQTVSIEPGANRMKPALIERAEALPTLKPRDLKKKPRARKQLQKV